MASLRQVLAQVLCLGAAMAAVLPAFGALPPQPSSNCQRSCGNVSIPYPFGIGPDDSPDHCSLPGFNLSCSSDSTTGGSWRPFFFNVEVSSISLQQAQARMRMDMSYSCYNASSGRMDGDDWLLNLADSPYRFSDTGNKFTVVGCGTLAYIGDVDNEGQLMSGCVSSCPRGDLSTLADGSCSGVGCCQTAIPKGLQYYQVSFDEQHFNKSNRTFSRCSFAALIESSKFVFSANYTTTTSAFNETYGGQPPILVDWAIGGMIHAR